MSLTDQNMLQMSQVLQSAQKCTRPPTRESRGGNGVLNASGEAAAPFATLDKTVSAFVGDVPGGSLERLGKPSRILTVICNASMSEPRHPLCRRYHTRLVGLRRSLASNSARERRDDTIAAPASRSVSECDVERASNCSPGRDAPGQHVHRRAMRATLTIAGGRARPQRQA